MCARKIPSAACSNPAVQGRQGPSGSSGPSVAAMDVALDQAWNQRVGKLLPSELNPVSKKINVRTEFSGAGTAEEAMLSSAVLYNTKPDVSDPVEINFESTGDWASSSRVMSTLNFPSACQFGDIMGMASEKLKAQLEEPITEKAS